MINLIALLCAALFFILSMTALASGIPSGYILGDLYFIFWNSGKDYNLRTEQEMTKVPGKRGDTR